MVLAELKLSLLEKTRGLSIEDLEASLRTTLLDYTLALALASGRWKIAKEKLDEGEKGFEVDKPYYTMQKYLAASELDVLIEKRELFREWFEEIRSKDEAA